MRKADTLTITSKRTHLVDVCFITAQVELWLHVDHITVDLINTSTEGECTL